ncbi:hypothetical protein BDAP_001917 [Binucleata daphniae]
MLLYILTPFLPTDHFIDLVNLFHIEAEYSLGIYIFGTKDDMHLCKINKIDGSMLRLLTNCYIHFSVLETDGNGTQKNVTCLFFRYLLNEKNTTNIYFNRLQCLKKQDLLICSNCFIIYIHKNVDKFCKNFKRTYDQLIAKYNNMQDEMPLDTNKPKDKNYLQTITKK